MQDCELIHTLNVQNTLGECILWNDINQSVWWTDIHNAVLYRYLWQEKALQKFALPERLCSFGFIANDERLICAFESGFAFYDPLTTDLQWLHKPEENYRGTRFNDGRVDRQGRFWAGTMVEGFEGYEGQAFDENNIPTKGGLYWISDTELQKPLNNIEISNSLCWSPDSSTMYFADSPTQNILAYQFDGNTAEFSDERVFASTKNDSYPDGSVTDAEGYLWNAHWGGSKVVRFKPNGDIDLEIPLPVTQPTCICFGGPNLDLLFVSTARENLSEEALASQPDAGNVFIFKTPYKGLPEYRFIV